MRSVLRISLLTLAMFAATGCPEGLGGGSSVPTCETRLTALGDWMRANMLPALQGEQYDRLQAGLEALRDTNGGQPEWKSVARLGIKAAEARDLDGIRKACKDCHRRTRSRYRSQCREK